jgi:hypothetical protein
MSARFEGREFPCIAERILVDLLVADPHLAMPSNEKNCCQKNDQDGNDNEASHALSALWIGHFCNFANGVQGN